MKEGWHCLCRYNRTISDAVEDLPIAKKVEVYKELQQQVSGTLDGMLIPRGSVLISHAMAVQATSDTSF